MRHSATPSPDRLEGWKAIANYFRRTVRTVQRWEREQGLPVRRHLHASLASAYALPLELEAWRATRTPKDEGFDPSCTAAETGDERLLTAMSRHYWNQRTRDALQTSIHLAEVALSRNALYAPAMGALARAYGTRATYAHASPSRDVEIAKGYALRALTLEPHSLEALQTLALVLLYFEWNWEAAKTQFESALAVDVDASTTHQWFTLWYLAQNRDVEALTLAQRAEALDPTSPVIAAHATWILHLLGRFDEAIVRSRAAIRHDRHFWRPYFNLAVSLLAKGRAREAADAAQIGAALNDHTAIVAVRIHALARSGDLAGARTLLARTHEERRYISPYWMAFACVGLDAHEDAFLALKQSLSEREWFLLLLNYEPAFADLRNDPRLGSMRRMIGLPEPASI